MKKGMVYLVGAGPGDPGLITVKALECIKKADVIIYDQLANPIFLKEAKPDAELIDVGKRAGKHTLPQSKINKLLVKKAKKGNMICRLKGGDPYVFGRGAEEAEELLKDKIPFEVIPGISSSIAAPAYAGIPVTHRECASTFAVITGHEDPTKKESSVHWDKLATAVDTLVILMGVGNLGVIVNKLVKSGRKLSTPVALVHHGTLPNQKTITGTLGTIIQIAKRAKLKPPSIIIVGDVVKKRKTLNWFEAKPLFGKKIVVTRTRTQVSEFAKQLTELGAEVIEYSTIEIQDISDFKLLDNAIKNIKYYDWVIFTSANGVDKFFQRLSYKGKDTRVFSASKIAAIGPATAKRLESYGLKADLVPKDEFRAESVVGEFKKKEAYGKKILLARAKEARDILPNELKRMGAIVSVVPVYETGLPRQIAEKFWDNGILPDMVTFSSSSTVENFVRSIPKDILNKMRKKTVFASIGPITTQTAKKLRIPIRIEASQYTIPGLTDAIINYYRKSIVN